MYIYICRFAAILERNIVLIYPVRYLLQESCIHTYTYTHAYIYIDTCIYTYIYIYLFICFVYLYVYRYIYMCIYLYIHGLGPYLPMYLHSAAPFPGFGAYELPQWACSPGGLGVASSTSYTQEDHVGTW